MSSEEARLHALCQENAVLARELSRVQGRVTRVLAEKSAEIAHLQAQIAALHRHMEEGSGPMRKGSRLLSLIGL